MKQTLKYIYNLVFDNYKFAESKHSLLLTLSSAVLAFSTTFLSDGSLSENLFVIASLIFALIAILYSFIALVARNVKIKDKKSKRANGLIDFKSVMHFNEKTYIEAVKKEYEFTNLYKADQMDYDLAREIISTSKLTWIKYIYFNFAVVFLFASIICLILTVIIRGQIW